MISAGRWPEHVRLSDLKTRSLTGLCDHRPSLRPPASRSVTPSTSRCSPIKMPRKRGSRRTIPKALPLSMKFWNEPKTALAPCSVPGPPTEVWFSCGPRLLGGANRKLQTYSRRASSFQKKRRRERVSIVRVVMPRPAHGLPAHWNDGQSPFRQLGPILIQKPHGVERCPKPSWGHYYQRLHSAG